MHLAAHPGAPPRDVQRIGLGQPDVAVDPGSFVKPAFAQGGIHPHAQHVLAAIVEKVGQIGGERGIAALVAGDEIAVDDHLCVAEHAIEFHHDALAKVVGRDLEHPTIPADAVLGPIAPQRLIAVRRRRIAEILEIVRGGRRVLRRPIRQVHRPIVRQIDSRPIGIVEIRLGAHRAALTGLGEGLLVGAETEILRQIAGVAEMELPSEIELKALAHTGHRGAPRRRRYPPRRHGRGHGRSPDGRHRDPGLEQRTPR